MKNIISLHASGLPVVKPAHSDHEALKSRKLMGFDGFPVCVQDLLLAITIFRDKLRPIGVFIRRRNKRWQRVYAAASSDVQEDISGFAKSCSGSSLLRLYVPAA